MIPGRLLLSDSRRQRLRDERLWVRESQRAREYNMQRIHSPCTKCRGRRRLLLRNVQAHLLCNGRHPDSRVWTGPGHRDSSDEEWEQHFWELPGNDDQQVDADVDVTGMLQQTVEHMEDPEHSTERLRQEVADAFAAADSLHEECMQEVPDGSTDVEECGNGTADRDG